MVRHHLLPVHNGRVLRSLGSTSSIGRSLSLRYVPLGLFTRRFYRLIVFGYFKSLARKAGSRSSTDDLLLLCGSVHVTSRLCVCINVCVEFWGGGIVSSLSNVSAFSRTSLNDEELPSGRTVRLPFFSAVSKVFSLRAGYHNSVFFERGWVGGWLGSA